MASSGLDAEQIAFLSTYFSIGELPPHLHSVLSVLCESGHACPAFYKSLYAASRSCADFVLQTAPNARLTLRAPEQAQTQQLPSQAPVDFLDFIVAQGPWLIHFILRLRSLRLRQTRRTSLEVHISRQTPESLWAIMAELTSYAGMCARPTASCRLKR